MAATDLNLAKQQLLDKLGPSYNSYIQLLGKWFRGAISKDEFDAHAKLLNEHDFALEHNRFWLAFFHHCANNATSQARNFHLLQTNLDHNDPKNATTNQSQMKAILNDTTRVKCLPNKILMRMRIFVTAWELGLDGVEDQVSSYVNLALQYFLKNLITALICTKTAYRVRESRFKYAIGVKPMNPYLSHSLKVYRNNLDYNPYQFEMDKMHSSIMDICMYNDTLFPSRLYEAQALYEYACSTTSISNKRNKRKLSEILLNQEGGGECNLVESPQGEHGQDLGDRSGDEEAGHNVSLPASSERRLKLYHLLIAFLTDRTIIPSQSLYSINLERIFTKLSC